MHSKNLLSNDFPLFKYSAEYSSIDSVKSLNIVFPPFSSSDTNPYTVNPSSVRVPVLSNTIIVILPATFTLYGEMQNIIFFFSLSIANIAPTVIAAGNAGGTVIVIRSSDLSTMSLVLYCCLNMYGSVIANPMNATNAKQNTKYIESE
jgi:hypothetical protein